MNANRLSPAHEGVEFIPVRLTAGATQTATNSIPRLTKSVVVSGVATDANDFVVLPALADCPDGHTIVMLASAGSNFEVRTPASSNEKINGQDSDGTKELLATDTTVIFFTKISNSVGWMSNPFTAIGAVATAVVPD